MIRFSVGALNARKIMFFWDILTKILLFLGILLSKMKLSHHEVILRMI